MRITVVAIVLAFAGVAQAQQPRAWPKPEQTEFGTTPIDVPITRIAGFPMVDVVIHGKTFRFALETGGAFIGVTERLATALGLPTEATGNPAGQGLERTARIDSLRLGNVLFRGVQAGVLPRFPGRDIDGIVSPPLLRDVLYTIDLGKGNLRLERGSLPNVDGKSILAIPRKDRGGRIDFPIDLGAVHVDPVLDTQAPFEVTISDSLETSLPLTSAPISLGQAGGPSQGVFTLRRATLRSEAKLGSITLPSMPVVFRNRAGPIAGLAFLEQFVITVDDANGRIRFVANGAPARTGGASGSAGKYMLGLRAGGSPPTVMMVEPGSNVDKAGIRVGDVFVAAAGKRVETLTPADWQQILATGDPVELTLERQGQRFTVKLTPVLR